MRRHCGPSSSNRDCCDDELGSLNRAAPKKPRLIITRAWAWLFDDDDDNDRGLSRSSSFEMPFENQSHPLAAFFDVNARDQLPAVDSRATVDASSSSIPLVGYELVSRQTLNRLLVDVFRALVNARASSQTRFLRCTFSANGRAKSSMSSSARF